MKVRCKMLLDVLGREVKTSPWLTIDAIYDVLSIVIESNGQVLARVFDDQKDFPSLHPLEQFEIAEHSMPKNWGIFNRQDGGLFLGPRAWSEAGYWERLLDGDPVAQQTFEAEREDNRHGNQVELGPVR